MTTFFDELTSIISSSADFRFWLEIKNKVLYIISSANWEQKTFTSAKLAPLACKTLLCLKNNETRK